MSSHHHLNHNIHSYMPLISKHCNLLCHNLASLIHSLCISTHHICSCLMASHISHITISPSPCLGDRMSDHETHQMSHQQHIHNQQGCGQILNNTLVVRCSIQVVTSYSCVSIQCSVFRLKYSPMMESKNFKLNPTCTGKIFTAVFSHILGVLVTRLNSYINFWVIEEGLLT